MTGTEPAHQQRKGYENQDVNQSHLESLVDPLRCFVGGHYDNEENCQAKQQGIQVLAREDRFQNLIHPMRVLYL